MLCDNCASPPSNSESGINTADKNNQMNKWLIGLIAPTILGLALDFFKAANPLYLCVLLTVGVILPALLIFTIIDWNKKSKEREANSNSK